MRPLTSVEHEAVHANLFVPSDAHPLYQLLLVAYGGQRGHEPAVAVVALSHIVRGRAANIELRFLEYILQRD
jgi:hypothetical protein